jgi:arylsulfatase A-like enzyme
MVDDQSYDTLEIYIRHLFLQLLNMAYFAKEGVLFENYFCILYLFIYLLPTF